MHFVQNFYLVIISIHSLVGGGGDRPIPFRSESATDHIVRAKILA